MKLHRNLAAALVALGLAAGTAHAQSGGDYAILRSAHTGGGLLPLTGGSYRLGGSLGQHDAGLLAAGDYVLHGGFWGPTETPTTGTGDGPVPVAFASRVDGSNPFRGSTRFAFALPATRRVSLAIYGVDGRVVRRWPAAERHAGRHTVAWDGRDDAGRPAAPGVYFAHLQAGEFSATHRVVRLD